MKFSTSVLNKLSPLFLGAAVSGKGVVQSGAANTDDLVANHFSQHSRSDHPCRGTLALAIKSLEATSATILETGSSAWGANSSLLWDAYVSCFGGAFETVDIRLEPCIKLRRQICHRTILHVDDSVTFLKKWSSANQERKVDLIYLDSWDVNWLDPLPAALHGLQEYLAVSKNLQPGSLLLIDDTPRDLSVMERIRPDKAAVFAQFISQNGFTPGKGTLVKILLEKLGRGRLIEHDYQLLWQF